MKGTCAQKVENDLVAFARSIADKRGRNAEWAEKAVRDSASVTETDASQLKVIDLIAEDVADLLTQAGWAAGYPRYGTYGDAAPTAGVACNSTR